MKKYPEESVTQKLSKAMAEWWLCENSCQPSFIKPEEVSKKVVDLLQKLVDTELLKAIVTRNIIVLQEDKDNKPDMNVITTLESHGLLTRFIFSERIAFGVTERTINIFDLSKHQ